MQDLVLLVCLFQVRSYKGINGKYFGQQEGKKNLKFVEYGRNKPGFLFHTLEQGRNKKKWKTAWGITKTSFSE